MTAAENLKCVGLSEVRDMTCCGGHLVIRSVSGEELIGRLPCPSKSGLALPAHGLNDDARLDLALELTFPASDPVAVSAWEHETASGRLDNLP